MTYPGAHRWEGPRSLHKTFKTDKKKGLQSAGGIEGGKTKKKKYWDGPGGRVGRAQKEKVRETGASR